MTPAELTEARKSLGLSQVELAKVLGIHPTMLNRWEHGKAKIPPYLWLALKGISRVNLSATWEGVTHDLGERILVAPWTEIGSQSRRHMPRKGER
jgi:transcriptional regulator with XRE-family HTH domain